MTRIGILGLAAIAGLATTPALAAPARYDVQPIVNGEPSTILFPHTDPGTGAVRQMRVEVSVRPVS